jgi:hypothetical protein
VAKDQYFSRRGVAWCTDLLSSVPQATTRIDHHRSFLLALSHRSLIIDISFDLLLLCHFINELNDHWLERPGLQLFQGPAPQVPRAVKANEVTDMMPNEDMMKRYANPGLHQHI